MQIGDSFGHYTIVRPLGRGGMGEVWLAEDTKLEREVALKVLPSEFAADPVRRERFEREAKAIAALNHPNIVTVYSVEEAHELHVLIMELVDGKTLVEAIPGTGMATTDFLEIAIPLAEALDAAHQQGILHRDLKPSNIMITSDGRPKILDFGLAKFQLDKPGEVPEVTPDQKTSMQPAAHAMEKLTGDGVVLGTTEYMAPEQLRGEAVDQHADIFSLGVVLYETLTGTHPFRRGSRAETISAILSEPAQPLEEVAPGVEGETGEVIESMLAKDPAERPGSMEEVVTALCACQESIVARAAGPSGRWGLRPAVAVPIMAALIVGAVFGYRYVARSRMVRWASSEAVPQARSLAASGDLLEAFSLAQEAELYISGDPALEDLFADISRRVRVITDPPGADLYYRDPLDPDMAWQHVGQTPFEADRFPAERVRWRIEKPGFQTVEGLWANLPGLELRPEGHEPVGMIPVPAGSVGWTALINLGGEPNVSVPLGEFYVGRFEVTNEEFKEFLDEGGYEDPQYWAHEFVRDGQVVSWEEAMEHFVDATGMPGPSTWRLGDYPEGQADFPVSGVSWYEAAAYAEFSEASLPTVFHWTRAAGTTQGPRIVPLSNLEGAGPEPVGNRDAISVQGAHDMAGNVREWCLNAVGDRRSILGGSWQDPAYMFGAFNDAQVPWDRSATNGFRTAIYPDGLDDGTDRVLNLAVRDYSLETPVPDEIFEVYKQQFAYDPRELNESVETVEDGSPYWTRERVTLDAAYPDDRLTVDLFLPRDCLPPYQVVVMFPGSGAIQRRANKANYRTEFLVRGGRAVLLPSYKGTYDRSDGETYTWPTQTARFRDDLIKWGKDLSRSIDYAETRNDLDAGRIAFVGFSWGGRMGTIFPAVETRIRVVVLWVGGLASGIAWPEADQINYVTRVTQPVLMLNGRFDQIQPYETAQLPMIRLLGAPEQEKKHVLYETSHFVPRDEGVKETLDWLDKYLGPVRR